MKQKTRFSPRTITVVAVMSALASVLMLLEIGLPFVPSFLKYDLSDLPALLTAYAVSPLAGVLVELIKNLLHLPFTHTMGVGELANFLVGVSFVLPAGLLYSRSRTKNGAFWGAVVGTFASAIISLPVNLYITYPFYAEVLLPMEAIIGMYRAILPSVKGLFDALLIFNLPFTFLKGAVNVLLCFVIYKPLSPILHGKHRKHE